MKLFKNTRNLEPSAALEGFILARIGAIGERRAQRKLVFSYAGILSSVVAVFYLAMSLGSGIIESEFFSLLALAFSDLGTVLANWKDFAYSLMETFPVAYASIVLVPIFTLLVSFNGYLNNHNHNRHYGAA